MSPPVRKNQSVMFLWLADSALDSRVVGWAIYNGSAPRGTPTPPVDTSARPPYDNGVEALRDGWRLIQAAQLIPPSPGSELHTSYLRHEFLFERFDSPSGEFV